MEKTENDVSQISKDNTMSHDDQQDGLFSLHLLANVAVQESLLEKEVELILNSTPSYRDGSIKNDSLKFVEKAVVSHMRFHPDGGNKATQMPLITKQTSEPRSAPVSRSSRPISSTWKVKENLRRKPASDRKCEFRPALVSRSGRPITVTRKVKENRSRDSSLDTNSQDILATAVLLLEFANSKRETCIWSFPQHQELPSMSLEPTEKNLDEPAQLNEKKCISKTTAPRSSRKRKLPSGEMQEEPRKKMKGGPHVCGICGKIFATGVQLGGHKRGHYDKEPTESVNRWSIRKSVDSELRFFLTIRKDDK